VAFDYPQGATPLDPDEVEGLRLTHISTREELNIFEAKNIQQGMMWAWRSRPKNMVSEKLLFDSCIDGCLAMFGSGLESFVSPIRILAYSVK